MDITLDDIRIEPTDLASRQLADQVREKILLGKLAAGTKLPPTEELARFWHTNIRNVQQALSLLAKEGLLSRMPGRGTIVRARAAHLTRIGMYVTRELCLDSIARFSHEVMSALTMRMDRFDIKHDLWMDPRPPGAWDTEWTDLTEAIRRREMQGVIAVSVSVTLRKWLDALQVPVAYLGDFLPTSVNLDTRQYLELSLRRLKEQGCRTVGWITGLSPGATRYFDEFMDLTKAMGLRVKSEWVCAATSELPSRDCEPLGYDKFRAIWRQNVRPEGIVVEDDVVGRGVISAILAQRVRVPEEVKMVFQANAEIPLVCPFPATFVEVSCGEVAEALLQQVQRSYRGEPCKMIQLPYRMRSN